MPSHHRADEGGRPLAEPGPLPLPQQGVHCQPPAVDLHHRCLRGADSGGAELGGSRCARELQEIAFNKGIIPYIPADPD
jgi:hypothetical protein